MAYNVGDVVTLDGIPCVIVYKADTEQSWGQYLCVDRDHDLCYYFLGDDYIKRPYPSNDNWSGVWGFSGILTGITSIEIGNGLNNTDSLIPLNSSQNTTKTVWNMVEDFREQYSDKFFIPTLKETNEFYLNKNYLLNLTDSWEDLNGDSDHNSDESFYYYGTSSEIPVEVIEDQGLTILGENNFYYIYDMSSGQNIEGSVPGGIGIKTGKNVKYRLCRYTTNQELDLLKKIQISTSTPQSQIYYTINNSAPTTSSTLYTDIFQVESGTTIKAIGVKEGYVNSDVAEFVVS